MQSQNLIQEVWVLFVLFWIVDVYSRQLIFLPCDTWIYLYNNIIVKFQKSTNENNQLYVSQSICQLWIQFLTDMMPINGH